MISASDVLNVAIQSDPWPRELLLGAVGPAAIAAVIAWIFSRAGRQRKDLEDWRETRHAKYSTLLAETDGVFDVITELRKELQVFGENVQPESEKIAELTPIASRLEEQTREIRLMGHSDIHRNAQMVAVVAGALDTWARTGYQAKPSDAPIWTMKRLQEIEDFYRRHVMAMESLMLAQLGIRTPTPISFILRETWDRSVGAALRRLGLKPKKPQVP